MGRFFFTLFHSAAGGRGRGGVCAQDCTVPLVGWVEESRWSRKSLFRDVCAYLSTEFILVSTFDAKVSSWLCSRSWLPRPLRPWRYGDRKPRHGGPDVFAPAVRRGPPRDGPSGLFSLRPSVWLFVRVDRDDVRRTQVLSTPGKHDIRVSFGSLEPRSSFS